MIGQSIAEHLGVLDDFASLSCGDSLVLVCRRDDFALPEGQLLIQELPTAGATILRPAVPSEAPGVAAELEAALALLRESDVADEFYLAFCPVDVTAGEGTILVQRTSTDGLEVHSIHPSDMQEGDLLHDTVVYSARSRVLGELTSDLGARMGHINMLGNHYGTGGFRTDAAR